MFKKLAVLVIVLGILVTGGTAIAASDRIPCQFISSSISEDGIRYHINTREISHIITIIDSKISPGMAKRYVLIIKMNNGHDIPYGRYNTEEYRDNAVAYIISAVIKCSQLTR